MPKKPMYQVAKVVLVQATASGEATISALEGAFSLHVAGRKVGSRKSLEAVLGLADEVSGPSLPRESWLISCRATRN